MAKHQHDQPEAALPPLARLLTVQQVAGRYPFTEAALRALILNAEDRQNSRSERIPGNGLAVALHRVGRRVLVDETAFVEWIVRRGGTPKAAPMRPDKTGSRAQG
jgi:hypothetical protein